MKYITNLDKEVSSSIAFFEGKYNCLISIESDDNNFYMNIAAKDLSYFEGHVLLCSTSDSKYRLVSAIRAYLAQKN